MAVRLSTLRNSWAMQNEKGMGNLTEFCSQIRFNASIDNYHEMWIFVIHSRGSHDSLAAPLSTLRDDSWAMQNETGMGNLTEFCTLILNHTVVMPLVGHSD